MRILNHIALLGVTFFAAAAFTLAEWTPAPKEEVQKALVQVKNWFDKHDIYELRLNYRSFENHVTQKSADESTGYFKRSRMNYHSMMLGIETIQNEKIRVMVDTSNKTILLAEPSKTLQAPYDETVFSKMLDKCQTFKKTISTTETALKINFPRNYYLDHYEITLANNGVIKTIVMYYAQELSTNPSEKDAKKSKPRVEIDFSAMKVNAAFAAQEFNTSRFISFDGKKYTPTKNFNSYKIYDTRYKN